MNMKKILSLLLLLAMLIAVFSACVIAQPHDPHQTDGTQTAIWGTSRKTTARKTAIATTASKTTAINTVRQTTAATTAKKTTAATTQKAPDPVVPSAPAHTVFTAAEKEMFTLLLGDVIPFAPNNEYYVEAYTLEGETGINFYTYGNTQAEFDAYRALYTSYTLIDTFADEYGDTWYTYQKDAYFVDLSFYRVEQDTCIDVYAYLLTEGGGGGGTDEPLYTDFTSDEKAKFTSLIGDVIPFAPNSEYRVEDYTLEGETGINFYTYGNTQAEFDAYRALYASYTLIDTFADEYGDTWYTYQKGSYFVDLSFYRVEQDTCIDVYAYITTESGGNTGGGDLPADVDLITNEGKGLPSGVDGIFDVDFTQAAYVKDVTDQGYYLDGCPTVGSPGVLVIPVEFSDRTAQSLGYDASQIAQAFMKDGNTDYHSVYDYYEISSYGQLQLDITVLDYWFRPQNTSTYYQNATIDYFDEQVAAGDQMIMNEALAYLEDKMDLSAFDSDKNGIIDAVVMINTLEIGDDDFHWAYRYWNIYTDQNDQYYEYDGVSANDYLWASYQFLYQSYDQDGNEVFDNVTGVNTYTYIHEFGHILGADDYYDTAGIGDPMSGCDVMDGMSGDHNAFTKFNFGWITSSRLVTAESSLTLTLNAFDRTGDTLILANNWDPDLGAYQEYYILAYYTATGLNAGEDAGYFLRDGLVVYHVNASLYREEINGDLYYDVYNNNTHSSAESGTRDNLIEYVKSDADTYTYGVGDTLPSSVTDHSGNRLIYTFTVDSVTPEAVTLTVTRAA